VKQRDGDRRYVAVIDRSIDRACGTLSGSPRRANRDPGKHFGDIHGHARVVFFPHACLERKSSVLDRLGRVMNSVTHLMIIPSIRSCPRIDPRSDLNHDRNHVDAALALLSFSLIPSFIKNIKRQVSEKAQKAAANWYVLVQQIKPVKRDMPNLTLH
jgi:hypothetical protein